MYEFSDCSLFYMCMCIMGHTLDPMLFKPYILLFQLFYKVLVLEEKY